MIFTYMHVYINETYYPNFLCVRVRMRVSVSVSVRVFVCV